MSRSKYAMDQKYAMYVCIHACMHACIYVVCMYMSEGTGVVLIFNEDSMMPCICSVRYHG